MLIILSNVKKLWGSLECEQLSIITLWMRKLKTSNAKMLLSSYPRIYKNWWFSTGKFFKSQVQRMTNQVKMKDKKGKGEDRKPMNFRKLRNVKTSLIFSKIVFLMMMIRMLKRSKQSLHVHVTLMIFCKLILELLLPDFGCIEIILILWNLEIFALQENFHFIIGNVWRYLLSLGILI